MSGETTQSGGGEQLLEQIEQALAGADKDRLHDLLQEFHPVDLAHLLDLLPLASREKIWSLFGAEVFLSDLLAHVHQALENEETGQVRSLLDGLDSDDIASLLTFLPSPERKAVWAVLEPERQSEVWTLASGEVKADVPPGDLLQRVHEALEQGTFSLIQELLGKLHPSDIAGLLESLPLEERGQVWELVAPELDGDVLAYVQGMVRETLLAGMEAAEVAAATEKLDTDDAVDILQDLPEDRIEQVLQAMDAQRRQRLSTVLSYSEDTAGGLMNTDVLTVRADVCLEGVLRYLRRHEELPDKTDMLLVIDRDNRYQGALPLSRLLTCDPKLEVGQVMAVNVAGLPPDMPARDVANLFARHDWISAPVVDDDGFLLGRITIDDVVDVIRDEADHDLMSRAGLDEENDMFAPVIVTARQRALWLGINLLTAFLAAWVIGLFEHTLEKIVALAVLMPIVASMGGVAGTQTVTVMVRGMALGKVARSNAGWLIRRELLVGVANGLVWALVVGGVAVLWFGSYHLGLIIGAAIVINLASAALSGTLIPLILRRLSIDPALAGGVILTTVTDVVGFFAFLGLATVFLLR